MSELTLEKFETVLDKKLNNFVTLEKFTEALDTKLNERFSDLEFKLDTKLNERFSDLEFKLDTKLNERFSDLEFKFDEKLTSFVTKEYFDKHYEDLVDFLSVKFEEVNNKITNLEEQTDGHFGEHLIRLEFMQSEIVNLRREISSLTKRTKEDGDVMAGEILKLKNRVNALERKLQTLKVKA